MGSYCSHTFGNLQGLRGVEEVPGQTKQTVRLPEEVVQKAQEASSIDTANTKTKPLRGLQELIKVSQGIPYKCGGQICHLSVHQRPLGSFCFTTKPCAILVYSMFLLQQRFWILRYLVAPQI